MLIMFVSKLNILSPSTCSKLNRNTLITIIYVLWCNTQKTDLFFSQNIYNKIVEYYNRGEISLILKWYHVQQFLKDDSKVDLVKC